MKKTLFILLILALITSCKPKAPAYNITGYFEGATDSTEFFIQKRVSGKVVTVDSAIAIAGRFVMKGGSVEYPEMVTLTGKNIRGALSFYIENSDINIKGHIDSLFNAVVEGSKTHNEYINLIKSLEPLNKKFSELYSQYREANQAGDKEKSETIEKQLDDLQKEMREVQISFIRDNPASFVAPAVLRNVNYDLEADEIEALINGLDTTVKKVQIIKDLEARVEVMKKVMVGQKAPDFELNDPDGNPVNLYSKVGKTKLLLIDFWASWCGPCRLENPNVVKIWKEFNKKGFDVFGVSLDRPGEKDKWLQAIKDDQFTWTHVSDLKYWDCEAAKLYAVNAIPANFLLDESGIIIARNLRGDDLYNKVSELLGEK